MYERVARVGLPPPGTQSFSANTSSLSLPAGGETPGVVTRAPNEDVEAETGHGRALSVDPGRLEVLLVDDLRVVVAELRAHDSERLARGRTPRRHLLPV